MRKVGKGKGSLQRLGLFRLDRLASPGLLFLNLWRAALEATVKGRDQIIFRESAFVAVEEIFNHELEVILLGFSIAISRQVSAIIVVSKSISINEARRTFQF